MITDQKTIDALKELNYKQGIIIFNEIRRSGKMKPLTQQLEDKKKELEDIKNLQNLNDGEWMWNERARQIIILKAEIAILEQAIAEMQKQRQDFEEKISFLSSYPLWTNIINKETGKKEEIPEELYPILDNFLAMIKKVLLEQLNQLKTEQ